MTSDRAAVHVRPVFAARDAPRPRGVYILQGPEETAELLVGFLLEEAFRV